MIEDAILNNILTQHGPWGSMVVLMGFGAWKLINRFESMLNNITDKFQKSFDKVDDTMTKLSEQVSNNTEAIIKINEKVDTISKIGGNK